MSEALQMADHLDRLCDPYDSAIAAELRRLHAENEALRAELAEQARVNGMGGEREARLMAVNAERHRICDMLLDMHAKEERHNYYGFIARMIKESA